MGNTSSVDIATEENMEALIGIGKELLKKPVARVNIDTGMYEPVAGEGTNEDALARFAKMLSEERKLRIKKLLLALVCWFCLFLLCHANKKLSTERRGRRQVHAMCLEFIILPLAGPHPHQLSLGSFIYMVLNACA
jgi:hypothetical protein